MEIEKANYEMENPWNIKSIYEMQYFNCPSCEFKNKSKQLFVNHAFDFHQNHVQLLSNITDNSLKDIICPWEIEDIKIEDTFTETYVKNVKCEGATADIDEILDIKNEVEENLENIDNIKEDFPPESDPLYIEDVNNSKTQLHKRASKNHKSNALKGCHTKKGVKTNSVCKICDKSFVQASSLIRHVSCIHDREIVYKCDHCTYETCDKYAFNRHIKSMHEGYKRFKCGFCVKSFFDSERLKRHVTCVHEKLKNYKCNYCTKAFGQKGVLKSHISAIHDQVKFDCEKCSFRTSYRESLDRHMKLRHIKKSMHEGYNKFKCDFCSKSFLDNVRLKRHVACVHEKLKNYKCNYCAKAFGQKGVLKTHISAIHDQVKFDCDMCSFRTSNKGSLDRHKKTIHKWKKSS